MTFSIPWDNLITVEAAKSMSYTVINDYGKFLNKFEEFGASDFFKESARIFRNPESLN
jgi:hypothetical protein